jgi:hypothetical protein
MLPRKEKKALNITQIDEKATHIEIKRSTNDRKKPENLIEPTDTTMVPYLLVFDQRME